MTNDEAQIRDLIDHWTTALRAKDVEGVLRCYAADVVSFDLAPPLQYVGTSALRRSLADWFTTFRGPIGYEIRDLAITAGHDVGFSRSLNRISGTRTDDKKTDVWVRATVGYRRIDGRWLIAHEHASVPFYMDGSGKAAVDLEPM